MASPLSPLARLAVDPMLDDFCSTNFCYRDLIECGETFHALDGSVANLPREPATWDAIAALCVTLLDPLVEHFGPIELTYGFASAALTRHINGRIAPSLDQHAGHELNRRGNPICPRLGQAVDLRVPDVPSGDVVDWIVEKVAFDRIYFYGDERHIHVSVGPDVSGTVVDMIRGPSGRLVPRVRR